MNDKKWIKIRIVAWSIVAVLLSIILVCGITNWSNSIFGNVFNNEWSISTLKQAKQYNIDDVDNLKNINIDFNTAYIIVNKTNQKKITINVKSNKKLKNKEYLKTNINSGTLNIVGNNKGSGSKLFKLFKSYYMEVQINIPETYNKNLAINNSVGDIEFISDLNFKKLDINSKTGDIVSEKKLNIDDLIINNKIGDVNLAYLASNNININSKTSDINIDYIDGKGVIDSNVGDVDCNISKLRGDIAIKSHIGDVDLTVNKDLAFKFKANTTFDKLDTDLKFNNIKEDSNSCSGEIGNNPSHQIKVDIKTGEIDIDN